MVTVMPRTAHFFFTMAAAFLPYQKGQVKVVCSADPVFSVVIKGSKHFSHTGLYQAKILEGREGAQLVSKSLLIGSLEFYCGSLGQEKRNTVVKQHASNLKRMRIQVLLHDYCQSNKVITVLPW